MLGRLREGRVTIDDYNNIFKPRFFSSVPVQEQNKFLNSETLLFSDNASVDRKNNQSLANLEMQIIRISAINSKPEARRLGSDKFQGLENLIHLAVGAKVMCISNLIKKFGLVNGSRGSIKDIVFLTQQQFPPINQPDFIIVDFPEYIGNSFFEEEARKTWFFSYYNMNIVFLFYLLFLN